MSINSQSYNRIGSERWVNFVKTVAEGLQLSIALVSDSDCLQQQPLVCPSCQLPYQSIDINDKLPSKSEDNTSEQGGTNNIISLPLNDGMHMVAAECECKAPYSIPGLVERAYMAQTLITSFKRSLSHESESGRRAVEISAIRRVSQVTLSLFIGDHQGVEKAVDLVLSALVILLDAKGSWLELNDPEDGNKRFIKGDRTIINNYIDNNEGAAETASICSSKISGRLGIIGIERSKEGTSLLNMMAQQCSIILEVDRLINLMQKQLSKVLGALGNAVFLIDTTGNITYANKCAYQITDNLYSNLLGMPISFFKGPWAPVINNNGKRATGYMEPFQGKDRRRWVNWQVAQIEEDGEGLGWIIIIEDKTDYYRYLDAGRRAERLATTATMVGSLAHEIRNPLSAALGLLELLGAKLELDKTRGYVDLIMRELDRVTKLLNEFLLMGRPADLAEEPVDMESLVKEITPLLHGEANTSKVTIELELESVSPIMGDPGQLTQVILNLVRNAVAAADTNGIVCISLQEGPEGVRLLVKDNGPGLSPQVMSKLFQPFFTTKERGTGLGLPVVQAIIHNHGGQISATNVNGGGALFEIVLPIHPSLQETPCSMDVIQMISDDITRFGAEHALRAAGFSCFSVSEKEELRAVVNRVKPRVLVVNEDLYESLLVEPLENVGHEIPFVIISSSYSKINDHQTESVFISQPGDYYKLISCVQKALANNG